MFDNEILNAIMGGIFGILIPALIAIKLLDWLFHFVRRKALKEEGTNIHKRLAKRKTHVLRNR